MSNLIKSNYVYINKENVRKIESDWQPVMRTVLVETDTVSDELHDDSFRSGLEVEDVSYIQEEAEQKHKEKLDSMLAVATSEAELIIAKAKEEAIAIRDAAMEDGRKLGYEEGLNQANNEIAMKKEELDQQILLTQSMVKQQVDELEPQFVSVMVDLIRNITGVVLNDHEEIILHLLQKGISSAEKCEELTIMVSHDDYEYVMAHEEKLVEQIGEKVSLNILKDDKLSKNQCLIDAKDQLLNCSLDEQLASLIADLKLLGKC